MGPDFKAPPRETTRTASVEDNEAWKAIKNNLLTQEEGWAISCGILLLGVTIIGIAYLLWQSGTLDPK